MTIVFAGNITRLLRKAAESGDRNASSVIEFAKQYIALAEQPEPDRQALQDLFEQVDAIKDQGWRYLRDVHDMISRLHWVHNVLPCIPTSQELDVIAGPDEPLLTIAQPVVGEGRFVRQTSSPGRYGHVVLTIEPLAEEHRIRLEWLLEDSVVPKAFLQPTFDGIAKVALEPLPEGGRLACLRIRITGGTYHFIDSSELSFRVAGSMAFLDAVAKAVLIPV